MIGAVTASRLPAGSRTGFC